MNDSLECLMNMPTFEDLQAYRPSPTDEEWFKVLNGKLDKTLAEHAEFRASVQELLRTIDLMSAKLDAAPTPPSRKRKRPAPKDTSKQ